MDREMIVTPRTLRSMIDEVADRGVILRSALVSETRPVLWGLACGLVLAAAGAGALVRVLQQTPVALDARDPVIYVTVAMVLAFAAVSAMLVPALRAAGSDPLRALRQD
jgi:ABC-type lipoprotein release transport system permease subunit